MASKKVGQLAVNWISLGARVPQAARSEFNAFRNRHEAIKASLLATKEAPPAIDWEHYKAAIKAPGFVEKFEAGVQSTEIPYPEDTHSAQIASDQAELETEIVAAIQESKENIVSLTKELDALRAEKPFEDMTSDEYLADHPELKAKIEDQLRNHTW